MSRSNFQDETFNLEVSFLRNLGQQQQQKFNNRKRRHCERNSHSLKSLTEWDVICQRFCRLKLSTKIQQAFREDKNVPSEYFAIAWRVAKCWMMLRIQPNYKREYIFSEISSSYLADPLPKFQFPLCRGRIAFFSTPINPPGYATSWIRGSIEILKLVDLYDFQELKNLSIRTSFSAGHNNHSKGSFLGGDLADFQ